jgi:hypothetical protein
VQGQYDKVIKEELPEIFKAFKRIDPKQPKYHPKLSIIICGKRHHARFYPTTDENADKNGNTRPGTVRLSFPRMSLALSKHADAGTRQGRDLRARL